MAARHKILRIMATTDREIVCDGRDCWIGHERTSWRVVNELLRMMAIKDVSDVKGARRYVINETGRAILSNKHLEDDVWRAALRGRPFAIRGGQIVELE